MHLRDLYGLVRCWLFTGGSGPFPNFRYNRVSCVGVKRGKSRLRLHAAGKNIFLLWSERLREARDRKRWRKRGITRDGKSNEIPAAIREE